MLPESVRPSAAGRSGLRGALSSRTFNLRSYRKRVATATVEEKGIDAAGL